ncbi:acetylglutamate semialdehyde dehydrogenase [Bacillus cereus]|uniref:acetylglutamate semialdehyde dehydrogenase n=1 Tax=Bacillus cereus TaxID=1396 RepID=UPI001067482F|nr:acetylglutamate semialdehyde dehydrogenase [Bacillus cereus]TEX16545.1 acetylglutamate semialdehyde dehydrogenase [Bacillus cereus]
MKGLNLKEYLLADMEAELNRFKAVTSFSNEELKDYSVILKKFKFIHESKEVTTNEKGKILEEIVNYIVSKSIVFDLHRNLRTSTNEIDLLVNLNWRGKQFKEKGFIQFEDNQLICECKNYKKKIDVTWVGKFYSLLSCSTCRLGILFSYKGLTGKGWNDAIGLSKKVYLLKEKEDEKIKIIDFNIEDFNLLEQGESFLNIIHTKLINLKYDTEILAKIASHPNEELIKEHP